MSKVEIYESDIAQQASSDGQDRFRWRVKASNGEIVASGEGYTRREDAVHGFQDAARAMDDAYTDFYETHGNELL